MMKRLWWMVMVFMVAGLAIGGADKGEDASTALRGNSAVLASPVSAMASGKLIWTPVVTEGFGNPNNKIVRGLEEFQGQLYAMVHNIKDGGEIYRSPTGEAGTWERVVDRGFLDFGNNHTPSFRSIRAWAGRLFVGTFCRDPRVCLEADEGAQIWSSTEGTQWSRVVDRGFGRRLRNASVRALEPFQGFLYAGTGSEFIGSAMIYRSATGQEWEPVVRHGFGGLLRDAAVYFLRAVDGYLYAGTFNLKRGAGVYRSSNGTSWERIASPGFGHLNPYAYDLRAYQPTPSSPVRLIVTTGGNPNGGEVWAYDGTRWALFAPQGFGKPRNTDMWAAGQFGADYYVGTFKLAGRRARDDVGAELWRYDPMTGEWRPETTDGFGNPDNTGIRVIFSWQGALYVGTQNKNGAELWKAIRP